MDGSHIEQLVNELIECVKMGNHRELLERLRKADGDTFEEFAMMVEDVAERD